jgi:hypothetical protein
MTEEGTTLKPKADRILANGHTTTALNEISHAPLAAPTQQRRHEDADTKKPAAARRTARENWKVALKGVSIICHLRLTPTIAATFKLLDHPTILNWPKCVDAKVQLVLHNVVVWHEHTLSNGVLKAYSV